MRTLETERKPPAPAAQAPSGVLHRRCSCGGTPGPTGECAECRRRRKRALQPKLRVNRPGDRYEREADRVADRVMRAPRPAAAPLTLTPVVQRAGAQGGSRVAPPEVDAALAASGRPLDDSSRSFMEHRFGHDFSRVRVHADTRAAGSALAVGARAYTVGRDIVFGPGEYRPASTVGRRLLAHELAHVVQQRESGPQRAQACASAAPFGVLQRTSVVVGDGCPGTEADINTAVGDARTGIGRIADDDARECLLDELNDATIECESGDVCGSASYAGSTIKIHKWGDGCPSLPALLVHEAAHKCKLFFTEEFAEACENEAFGGRGATPPPPDQAGGTCEL